MIRIAAVGDVHYGRERRDAMRTHFEALPERADILLLAGDLTQRGLIEEARALADDLRGIPIPIVAVLGNHDFHSDQSDAITNVLIDAGVRMLEGKSTTLEIAGVRVGVMGVKGFGGGFGGACCTDFGEPETKAFARHSKLQADILREGLLALDAEFKIGLTHYSPCDATLLGEKREIYPFLGSYLLGEALDDGGAHAAFHGHAHLGAERGMTAGGVPVRNVAQMVIRHAYNIYSFEACHGTGLEQTQHAGL